MAVPVKAHILRDALTDPTGFGSGTEHVSWPDVRRIGYVLDSPRSANPVEYLAFQTNDPGTAWWIDTQGFGRQASAWRATERYFGRLEIPTDHLDGSVAHQTIWPRSETTLPMYADVLANGLKVVHREAVSPRPTLLPLDAIDADELEAAPVWVASSVEASLWHPWPGPWPVDPSQRQYLVKSTFHLHNGTRGSGAIDLGPATERPVLFLPDGGSIDLCSADLVARLDAAGLSHVLPIEYEPDQGLVREPRRRRLGNEIARD